MSENTKCSRGDKNGRTGRHDPEQSSKGTEYLPAVHRYTLYKGDEITEFQRSYMYAMGESENTKCSRKIRMEQSSK